jgi:hypothetical protein
MDHQVKASEATPFFERLCPVVTKEWTSLRSQ